jgi:hypothetical protein
MSLQGLPDFHEPIQGDGFQIFYPFEGVGSFTLAPARLEVAERADGRPDFLLQLIRSETPSLPPEPHGVLDMHVQPRYPLDDGLARLRSEHPQALLAPALFSSGFMRMRPQEDTGDLPADMRIPMPLAWNGLAAARSTMRLSLTSALLLRGALQGDTLALIALVELEICGVAARLPIQVGFDPNSLLTALLALGNTQRQVARSEIVRYFRQDLTALPLEVNGEVQNGVELAETLTDWVRSRFGIFCAAPDESGQPFMALPDPATIGTGHFQWDLSQPMQTFRPLALMLHPLDAGRQLVQDLGIAAAVPDPIIVPPVRTGIFEVIATANLPNQRPGVAAVGVTVRAAPFMPFRPQAVVKTVLLAPPQDMETIYLQLSPREQLEYTFSTFVVLATGQQFSTSVAVPHRGARLDLTPDDFPVQFIVLDADRSLLTLGDVHGTLRWTTEGVNSRQDFELTLAQPALALPLPRDMNAAELEIQAQSRDGDKILSLGPLPAKAMHLGLHLFPEYGPHHIPVECMFGDGPDVVLIELLPEGRADAVDQRELLFLTRDQPRKSWSYLAQSPFAAGYRYRLHANSDDDVPPWSELRSPFETLTLDNPIAARGTP